MTLEQLTDRVVVSEDKCRELEDRLDGPPCDKPPRSSFGMFADDPEIDEVLRLGREYRDQENRRDL